MKENKNIIIESMTVGLALGIGKIIIIGMAQEFAEVDDYDAVPYENIIEWEIWIGEKVEYIFN